MVGSWWHSFIGNVIGEQGRMTGWVYEDPGDGTYGTTASPWGPGSYIWKLGYDPTHWEQAADPKVKSTTIRDGNFDYLTNQVRWDRAPETLPPSLYLRAKPAFFGSSPWPWVDPIGGTKLGVLPARIRFDQASGTTSNPDQPTSDPDQPTSDPDQPTSDPDQPTSDPDQPTSSPGQSGSSPGKSGSAPGKSGSAPGQLKK
jgi:hypothetical protein